MIIYTTQTYVAVLKLLSFPLYISWRH